MAMSAENGSVVPPCPQGLSIEKRDFMGDQFSVDTFLTRWNAASSKSRSLEHLRDDLGIYLKILRSSMIELINEDYADFVDLSTNLVGLDKSIGQIKQPLEKYRLEVEAVRQALDDTIGQLRDKLKEREVIYGKKMELQNLEHITNTLAKVERLLGLGSGAEQQTRVEMTGDLIERVATEINHLNFCVSKCQATSFVEEMQPRLKVIGDHLHGALESQLLDAIEGKNAEILKRCLRIFATVDRVKDAERLVRTRIIRTYLEEIISEKSLMEDPLGLKGLLQRVLRVIPDRLSTLLQLTGPQAGKKQSRIAKDYDFLTNALFPEIVDLLDDNVSFIFSAGNPEKFFVNYKVSVEFLLDFEKELKTIEAIEQFRETDSYKAFLGRWNLPVYFQIKFQEIALPVEHAMKDLFKEASDKSVGNFRLASTATVVKAVSQCWDSSVFLDSLAHRFWKLTLQIIARFSQGVLEGPEMIVPKVKETSLKPSATNVALNEAEKRHHRSSSDTSTEVQHSQPDEKYRERPKDLINLFLDVQDFCEYATSVLLIEHFQPRFSNPATHSLLSSGLQDGLQSLQDCLPQLTEFIVTTVTGKCLPYLRQVSDIPRLYRRTNRDLPSKPCTYMTALLSPISGFHSQNSSVQPLHQWMVSVFTTVTVQFLSNVSEVLAAVQKMEESLRRLKRVRDTKTSAGGQDTEGNKTTTVSDDDKIRLQLYLDVMFYIDKMEKEFGVGKAEVNKLDELEKIVTEATDSLTEVRVSF